MEFYLIWSSSKNEEGGSREVEVKGHGAINRYSKTEIKADLYFRFKSM